MCSTPVEIDSVVVIREQKDFIALNLKTQLLKDNNGVLTIDSVVKITSGFQYIESDMYGLRHDGHVNVYWLKFLVKNETGKILNDLVCLQPGIDSVEQFAFNPDSTLIRSSIASNEGAKSRYLFISRELALPISLQPGLTTVYLRMINKTAWSQQRANIMLSIADENSFVNYFLESKFYQGAALGMLLLILVLHIFIYLFFRDATYLIYMVNILLTLMYLLLRKNYQLEFDVLSPTFPYAMYFHDPFDFLLTLTAVWFSQAFLNTKKEDPLLHKIMNVLKLMLIVGFFGSISLRLLEEMNWTSLYLGFFSAITVLIAAIRSYRRGNSFSIYVFFGFIPLVAAIIIYLVPSPDYLHYRSNETDVHYFAEALRAIIFTIGITDRFYQFKKAALRSEFEKEQLKFNQEKQIQNEKERISRDLHDNIGSQLAVLSLDLNSLSNELKDDTRVTRAQQDTQYIIEQLRDTVWAIENNQVSLDDIESKLSSLILSYRKRISHIEFELEVADDIKTLSLNPSQAINMYRIIQEAIQNSVKHSGCDRITVRFTWFSSNKVLQFRVSDNGSGFVYTDDNGNMHHGIKNMKKRADEINALIEIRSAGYTEIAVEMSVTLTESTENTE
ncbi:MAG: 7TM diverse intracellular signaling domain-containing protein [Bacteroidota bacterium]